MRKAPTRTGPTVSHNPGSPLSKPAEVGLVHILCFILFRCRECSFPGDGDRVGWKFPENYAIVSTLPTQPCEYIISPWRQDPAKHWTTAWAAWRGWDLRPGRQPGLGVDFHSLILCPGLSLSLEIVPFTPMLLWGLNLEPRALTSRKNTKTVMWLPGKT